MENLDTLTLEELGALKDRVTTEWEISLRAIQDEIYRRHVLAEAEDRIAEINLEYVEASGRKNGDVWEQPQGAHDAYRKGVTVARDGVLYESMIPNNVWMPGDPSDPQAGQWWKKVEVPGIDPPPGPGPGVTVWTEWINYKVGDMVTYNGATYRCRQMHNAQPGWHPSATPALWEPVTA